MVFSILNELLTSCQLSMQMKESSVEGWLELELECTTLESCEINHSCFNSCLHPCISCHAGVFFHYNIYHIRKALWGFWRCLEMSLPKYFIPSTWFTCCLNCGSPFRPLTPRPNPPHGTGKLLVVPMVLGRNFYPSLTQECFGGNFCLVSSVGKVLILALPQSAQQSSGVGC